MISTNPFKYIVGQEVLVNSKDRNLNNKKVKILTRFNGPWDDGRINTNSYKVSGDGIIEYLSFYEDQLKPID